MNQISKKIITISSILLFIVIGFFYYISSGSATGFSWSQNNWLFDASTDTAHHNTHQEGWLTYSYKDEDLKIENNKITIDNIDQSWDQVTVEDFSQGDLTSNVVISSAGGGGISLKRPAGYECAHNSECLNNLCQESVCVVN